MRFTAVFLIMTAVTFALSTPAPRKHAFSHHLKSRQLEEELIQGAEDSIELFDYPRVHDTTEQIHERTQSVNESWIVAAVRAREGRQRMPASYSP